MARTPRAPAADYEFGGTFRAPLPFVYRWCLDYAPGDAKLSKEEFERRVLARSVRRVVYQDLEDGPRGWRWSQVVVTKHPPNRWHAEITGSHRNWSLDYELRALPDGRTQLVARGRRRPTPIGEPNPARAALERELGRMWTNYGRALEREYRAGQRRPLHRP